MDKTITIIIGAVLTMLGAFGIIQANEQTALLTYSSDVIVGCIGIYEIVRGIIKRHKAKKALDKDEAKQIEAN